MQTKFSSSTSSATCNQTRPKMKPTFFLLFTTVLLCCSALPASTSRACQFERIITTLATIRSLRSHAKGCWRTSVWRGERLWTAMIPCLSPLGRYFFTLSAHPSSLCFLLVVITGLTYKVLLFLLSLSFLNEEIRHPQFKISTSYIRDSFFIWLTSVN